MNTKTQKQDTDQRQGNNQGYQQNDQRGNRENEKRSTGQDKDWNSKNRMDSGKSGDDRQDPEIDMPADTPEETEKKIPKMNSDL